MPRESIRRISGMPLHPRFYPRKGPEDRARVRAELGFVDEDFVALLLFGGKGAPEMAPLAEELLASPGQRVIAVCGDNPALYERLAPAEARARGRLVRLGFSDRVPDLLAAADVLVTKPGPGSLAEAFHQKVPVVVPANGHTIPQERWNARFVKDKGLGFVVKHASEAPERVRRLRADEGLRRELQFALRSLGENRATDEALDAFAAEIR
jgi:1,2-diacylglycerol 3-beta-galactosyltransferase